jgi:hypothetical protein
LSFPDINGFSGRNLYAIRQIENADAEGYLFSGGQLQYCYEAAVATLRSSAYL